MRVTELFHKPPATLPADATLSDAAAIMDTQVVGAVVIVDDGHPVGIVTDRDIALRGVARRLPADARVDAVMSTDLVTLPADADISDAVKAFDEHGFRRLPLVDGDRMVGMITVDDLVVRGIFDFTRLLRPVLGQVLFGQPEPNVPAAAR